MKNAIIVGTYPTTRTTEKMLVSCLKRLKPLGWDIILVSHEPVPAHIQRMVNYFIFDSENVLDPIDLTPVYWYHTHEFSLTLNARGHIATVTRNMENGIFMAHLLKYDFFFYMESDNLIDEKDLKNITMIEEMCRKDGKKMVLFEIKEGDSVRYESLMFAGVPYYFINTLPSLRDHHDLRKHRVALTLEEIFYDYFKDDERCMIIPGRADGVFHNSEINIIANHFRVNIVRSNTGEYFLWTSNSADNKHNIDVQINDNPVFTLPPNGYYFEPVSKSSMIEVKSWEKGIFTERIFFTTEKSLFEYDKNGELTFRQ